ncbi:hypothetical protein [Mumia sp. Pv 4-285]|uniref:hypothetical protein n=1 Tax=Mumia qirimensis TaxID=3234852 RepID=UPI00351CFB41
MSTFDTDPPFVDEHVVTVPEPRERVWQVLEAFVRTSLLTAAKGPLALILGTDPPGGFAVAVEVPQERIELVGRHRFSRYRLVFAVADGDEAGSTRLSARSYATFLGPHGAVYRALVIRTGFHVLATTRILRQVRRLSRSGPPGAG